MRRESREGGKVWKPLLARQTHPAWIVGSDRKVLAASKSFRVRFSSGKDPTGRACYELTHRSQPPCSGAGDRCPLERPDGDGPHPVHRHLTCLGTAYEQVNARFIPATTGRPAAFLLTTTPLSTSCASGFLFGDSPAVLKLLDHVVNAAAVSSPLLIRGESGTCKACVARLVHDLSDRSARPFVPMDCSEAEDSRLELDLFGRDMADGVLSDERSSLIAAADGGTLFLREPQLLAPSLQQRITQKLEDASDPATCRWIFASSETAARPRGILGQSLGDVSSLLAPPLRDRLEDLPQILDRLIRRFRDDRRLTADPAVVEALSGYSFPGNIRELECLVERACLLATDRLLPGHFALRAN